MNPILSAAVEIQNFILARSWSCCIIGGLAVLRWGRPRTTQDVDISVFVEFGDEASVIDEILVEFEPRIEDAFEFALTSRTILARSSAGVALDILLAQFEFERDIINRATRFKFDQGMELITISREDLIVLKAFAGREQDWSDVEGILACADSVDVAFVRKQLHQLTDLVDDKGSVAKMDSILSRFHF